MKENKKFSGKLVDTSVEGETTKYTYLILDKDLGKGVVNDYLIVVEYIAKGVKYYSLYVATEFTDKTIAVPTNYMLIEYEDAKSFLEAHSHVKIPTLH